MSKTSSPVRPSDCQVVPGSNSSGSTPMPTRLLRWIRSKLAASTARTPSRNAPLAAQSRLEPVPYSVPGQHHQRHAFRLVLHRRVVDRHHCAVGQMPRDAAFGAGGELVADADVGERAAGHHAVVAAAGAVAVEVRRLDAERHQVLARRAVLGDRTGRRDVVGRHRIAQRGQARGRRGSARSGSAPA